MNNSKEIIQKIEQVADVLACAQTYDAQVLADLHRWFNHLFRQACSQAMTETAAVSAAAARVLENIMLGTLLSQSDASNELDNGCGRDKEKIKFMLASEVNVRLAEMGGAEHFKTGIDLTAVCRIADINHVRVAAACR